MPPRRPEFRASRLAELQQLAHDRGGRCLSRTYVDLTTPMSWVCAAGHRWDTAARVVRAGSWCPTCVGRGVLGLADMKAAARERGGLCLSKVFTGVHTPMRWRCAEGHEWEAPAGRIRRGSWCPRCAGRTELADLQAFAAARGGRCLARHYVHGSSPVRWECAQGHRFTAMWRVVKLGRWCGECRAPRPRKTIAAMQALAARRGGTCLSTRYVRHREQLRWRCAEGHEWAAQPATIATGRWCPTCADTRLGIDFMRKLARERGGRCLSKEYVNGRVHLLWECCNGHRWQASPGNVHNRGSWCPTCAREQARSDARDRR